MSKITEIQTPIRIELMQLCNCLADEGYRITVKDQHPTMKIFRENLSTREVEVTEENYGYEVRITVISCHQDYELFRDCVKHLMKLTGGTAIYEDYGEITDPIQFFNKAFIEENVNDDVQTIFHFARKGEDICIFGPYREFYIGKNLVKKIEQATDSPTAASNMLFQIIRKSQYEIPDGENTTVCVIRNNDVNPEKQNTITIYSKNGSDYISYANFFSIFKDQEQIISIPYECLHHIVPASWELIDELQYKTAPLSDKEFEEFYSKAEKYETELN